MDEKGLLWIEKCYSKSLPIDRNNGRIQPCFRLDTPRRLN